MKIPVTTGELPNEIGRAARSSRRPGPQPREEDANKFGLQVQELTKEVAARSETERAAGRDRDRRGR